MEEDMQLFLTELEELCKKHEISISHEDGHGAFILTPYDEHYMNWIKEAYWEES